MFATFMQALHPYPSVWCVWSNVCGQTSEAVVALLILAGVIVMIALGLYVSQQGGSR